MLTIRTPRGIIRGRLVRVTKCFVAITMNVPSDCPFGIHAVRAGIEFGGMCITVGERSDDAHLYRACGRLFTDNMVARFNHVYRAIRRDANITVEEIWDLVDV